MGRENLRRLQPEELRALYRIHMCRDFPASELKSFERIRELTAGGDYAAYGYFTGDALDAYALTADDGEYVLLDYLAVTAERGGGRGSRALAALAELYAERRAMLGEVETPDTAAGEQRLLRERRYRFYERNGWRATGIYVVQYGEKLEVFCRDLLAKPDREELRRIFERFYGRIYGADYTAGRVAVLRE